MCRLFIGILCLYALSKVEKKIKWMGVVYWIKWIQILVVPIISILVSFEEYSNRSKHSIFDWDFDDGTFESKS